MMFIMCLQRVRPDYVLPTQSRLTFSLTSRLSLHPGDYHNHGVVMRRTTINPWGRIVGRRMGKQRHPCVSRVTKKDQKNYIWFISSQWIESESSDDKMVDEKQSRWTVEVRRWNYQSNFRSILDSRHEKCQVVKEKLCEKNRKGLL